jgi:hypothetical protein
VPEFEGIRFGMRHVVFFDIMLWRCNNAGEFSAVAKCEESARDKRFSVFRGSWTFQGRLVMNGRMN